MPGVVNTVAGWPRPPYCELWHIAGIKRRCWLREKTTKCLWQEASTLRQRQQNIAFNCTQWQICSLRNNKRLYSTFCTVEANYWPTRSIARPLCDSRATCLLLLLQLLQALDADSSARNMQLANRFREIDDAIGDNVDNVTRVITWPAKPPDSQPSISLYWVLWLD